MSNKNYRETIIKELYLLPWLVNFTKPILSSSKHRLLLLLQQIEATVVELALIVFINRSNSYLTELTPTKQ